MLGRKVIYFFISSYRSLGGPTSTTYYLHFSFTIKASSFLRLLLSLASSQIVLNGPDHLVAHLGGLGKTRAEVLLDVLEFLAVAVKVTEGDAVGPVL